MIVRIKIFFHQKFMLQKEDISNILPHENAYNNKNTTIQSFSALYAKENITEIHDTVNLSNQDSELYIIIDNKNITITPNDATPKGTILLNVKIEVIYSYEYD